MRTTPKQYRITMRAENTRFNAEIYIDVMYIEESVRETILTLWATVYTGLQNKLVFDDGSQLKTFF